MRVFWPFTVVLAACGEPTRYPARPAHFVAQQPATSTTGEVEAQLYCGRPPTDQVMNLTLINERDEWVEVFTVDADCNQLSQGSLQAQQIFTLQSISTEFAFAVYNSNDRRVFSFILPPDTTEADQFIR